VELYLHFPYTPSWGGAQLKHRDNFAYFTYLYKELRDLNKSLGVVRTVKYRIL